LTSSISLTKFLKKLLTNSATSCPYFPCPSNTPRSRLSLSENLWIKYRSWFGLSGLIAIYPFSDKPKVSYSPTSSSSLTGNIGVL